MDNKEQKELVIYQGKDGAIQFRGDFNKETIWGTKKHIADLFRIDISVVSRYIGNIFKDKELNKKKRSVHILHRPLLMELLRIRHKQNK